MRKLERRVSRAFLIVAGGLLLAGAGGVAAIAGTATPGTSAALQAAAPGAGRDAASFDLGGASSRPVFQLRNGDQVSVLSGPDGRCLLRVRSGSPDGEACTSAAGAASGQSISITDECGTSGHDRMEITGIAPEGSSEVGLHWSDGTTTATSVIDGAFRFEGANPSPEGRYPTGVVWLTSGGVTGSAALPVREGTFCLSAAE